ncbi:MAG: family helicase [Pedobacter sp.]|nr:family helicase [Pedobacter sp.]
MALLKVEREEDLTLYQNLTEKTSAAERRENGVCWFPIAIRGTEIGRGDYITLEVERTSNLDISTQFRSGSSVQLFSNHDPKHDRLEGTVAYLTSTRMKVNLLTDELPDWSRNGKLGIDLLFDNNSYVEMENALKDADKLRESEVIGGRLINILTGKDKPTFKVDKDLITVPKVNPQQQLAVNKILAANELAIVHGPPGTGKTTTLIEAIKALTQQQRGKILVVAPSNTAVDLLSEKMSEIGLDVVRIGNPARVSAKMLRLTLDNKMAEHHNHKDIKALKKQAGELKNMAHKYKRNFGKSEQEQRKALFAEAHRIMKDVEKTEQYIIDQVLASADVITATLVGASHYTIRDLQFHTVVIDEAGQGLEPACWIPILRAEKVVFAGDHCQLPPTIKSLSAAKSGLSTTLFEKCIVAHPVAVVLLQEQYRMHEDIMGYPSQVFYGNKLLASASVNHKVLFIGDEPLEFIDTAGCGFNERLEGTSVSNPEEATFVLKHLSLYVDKLTKLYTMENFPTIGVVSPYQQQIKTLKELIPSSPLLAEHMQKITINTIDSFQGQERDVIYISLTRSNAERNIGFLADIRRMNVAMTRAKKKLVVIGDSVTLSRLPFYSNFISYADEKQTYHSAWEFVDE